MSNTPLDKFDEILEVINNDEIVVMDIYDFYSQDDGLLGDQTIRNLEYFADCINRLLDLAYTKKSER